MSMSCSTCSRSCARRSHPLLLDGQLPNPEPVCFCIPADGGREHATSRRVSPSRDAWAGLSPTGNDHCPTCFLRSTEQLERRHIAHGGRPRHGAWSVGDVFRRSTDQLHNLPEPLGEGSGARSRPDGRVRALLTACRSSRWSGLRAVGVLRNLDKRRQAAIARVARGFGIRLMGRSAFQSIGSPSAVVAGLSRGEPIVALADRLTAGRPVPIHGSPCSVGVLLDTLDGAELEALNLMLGTPEQRGWSAPDIYDALTAEGYEVGRQSINRHRAGKCRCAKDVA